MSLSFFEFPNFCYRFWPKGGGKWHKYVTRERKAMLRAKPNRTSEAAEAGAKGSSEDSDEANKGHLAKKSKKLRKHVKVFRGHNT